MLISSPKIFLTGMLLSASIIISCVVPILSFITIPGIITVFMAMLIDKIHDNDLSVMNWLKYMNFHLPIKIGVFAGLIILPATLIIASGTYLYNSISVVGNKLAVSDPMAIYAVFITVFITLLWGIPFMCGNILAMKEKPSILVCCVEGIEALIKNPITMFVLCVNWFMAIAFTFFLLAASTLFIGSLGLSPLAIISNYAITFILVAIFICCYFMNIAVVSYQIMNNDNAPQEIEEN